MQSACRPSLVPGFKLMLATHRQGGPWRKSKHADLHISSYLCIDQLLCHQYCTYISQLNWLLLTSSRHYDANSLPACRAPPASILHASLSWLIRDSLLHCCGALNTSCLLPSVRMAMHIIAGSHNHVLAVHPAGHTIHPVPAQAWP
jgi:hypothetical protein